MDSSPDHLFKTKFLREIERFNKNQEQHTYQLCAQNALKKYELIFPEWSRRYVSQYEDFQQIIEKDCGLNTNILNTKVRPPWDNPNAIIIKKPN